MENPALKYPSFGLPPPSWMSKSEVDDWYKAKRIAQNMCEFRNCFAYEAPMSRAHLAQGRCGSTLCGFISPAFVPVTSSSLKNADVDPLSISDNIGVSGDISDKKVAVSDNEVSVADKEISLADNNFVTADISVAENGLHDAARSSTSPELVDGWVMVDSPTELVRTLSDDGSDRISDIGANITDDLSNEPFEIADKNKMMQVANKKVSLPHLCIVLQ